MNLARITLTIPENVLDLARVKAASQRKSLSKYVSEVLAKELNIHPPKILSIEEKMKALGTISSGKKNFVLPSRDELYKERTKL